MEIIGHLISIAPFLRLELNDGSKTYPTPPDNQRPDYPTLPEAAGTTQTELP